MDIDPTIHNTRQIYILETSETKNEEEEEEEMKITYWQALETFCFAEIC